MNNAAMGAELIRIKGLVQGVGFRPTVWRLAHKWRLKGTVRNDGLGVLIHVRGNAIEDFLHDLSAHLPPQARIDHLERRHLINDESHKWHDFDIVYSQESTIDTDIAVDTTLCSACLVELFAPDNRRFEYPFTNCTHCGPRLSIIKQLPYDRDHTSMSAFAMCGACHKEYHDPSNRRFHAQPIACPDCGPQLTLLDQRGHKLSGDPLQHTIAAIQQGQIVAVKGVGGFHLLCDASNEQAVVRLRTRKFRPHKPFALMARDVAQIKHYTYINDSEKRVLLEPVAPIVLLQAKPNTGLANSVAPGLQRLGFMLPQSPLHILLMRNFEVPVVATSGNKTGLAPCLSNTEAMEQLATIADLYLLHDREIVNRLDDSVVRVFNGERQVIRRGRGLAPASFALPTGFENIDKILALGGELKSAFCVLANQRAILSQHMGDTKQLEVFEEYLQTLATYQQMYQHNPSTLVVDAHPDYNLSQWGKQTALNQAKSIFYVQHHHAHIASCLANQQRPLRAGKVLGIALDGSGFGADGSLWGGEFLYADYHGFDRVAHLVYTPLPGGEKAILEPWRCLVAQLYSHLDASTWQDARGVFACLHNKPVDAITTMMNKGFNTPASSSVGRLFDAVAAAVGGCADGISYEGQAAIELEASTTLAICLQQRADWYPFTWQQQSTPWTLCTTSLWQALLDDYMDGVARELIAARFHGGLARALAVGVEQLRARYPFDSVALSGGVWMNQLLQALVQQEVSKLGCDVLLHTDIPANDGGLALGQALIAAANLLNEGEKVCA